MITSTQEKFIEMYVELISKNYRASDKWCYNFDNIVNDYVDIEDHCEIFEDNKESFWILSEHHKILRIFLKYKIPMKYFSKYIDQSFPDLLYDNTYNNIIHLLSIYKDDLEMDDLVMFKLEV